MEWKVVDEFFPAPDEQQILKVIAPGNLTFVIWIKSNLEVPLTCTLTPVIDGYIANHNKGHFVTILQAKPFCANEWATTKEKSIPHPLILNY